MEQTNNSHLSIIIFYINIEQIYYLTNVQKMEV